mmetsp:Transcript_37069/g.88966  ORF Transcript_37069/g.88966 Transcript_37069/m.88966 type:complete len:356 (+) Transcript_37069:463-1530(+)
MAAREVLQQQQRGNQPPLGDGAAGRVGRRGRAGREHGEQLRQRGGVEDGRDEVGRGRVVEGHVGRHELVRHDGERAHRRRARGERGCVEQLQDGLQRAVRHDGQPEVSGGREVAEHRGGRGLRLLSRGGKERDERQMPARGEEDLCVARVDAQVGDGLYGALLHRLVVVQQQARHARQRAGVAQCVAVWLRVGERGDGAGGVRHDGGLAAAEHGHQRLDGDAQHVGVALVRSEGRYDAHHGDARRLRVGVERAAVGHASGLLPQVGGGEGADHVRERAETVEHLAGLVLLRERGEGGGGLGLRLEVGRGEQPHDGRDRVEIGEQRAPLVHVLHELGHGAHHVLLHGVRAHRQHVE